LKAPELISERLFFEPLGEAHLSNEYVYWMNDPEVNMYLESRGDYSLKKLELFLKNVESNSILFWAIRLKDSGKHIGNIKIDPVNERSRIGEYGILIGDKKEWGKGYATEASKAILDFCFSENVQLRKVTLGVVVENESAVLLYRKLGFIQEGLLKQQAFHLHKWCDVIRMAIFNPSLKF
jgi:[ribosomal protein S5]-alanine N-acetyltransferase